MGLGWSAAQFELTSVSLGSVGVIDITNGSIPLILACAIVYMTIKSIIGFGMQPKEVRRWSLAQLDCKLCWFLVRATLLMLAAGGLHRSVDTFILVLVGTLAILFSSYLLIFVGTMAMTPVFQAKRDPSREASPVPSIGTAWAWSEFIVTVLVIALLVAFGFALLNCEPFLPVWTEPPDPIAVVVFVGTAVAVVVSLKLQKLGERKLFGRSVPILTKEPDGTIGVSFPSEDDPDQVD